MSGVMLSDRSIDTDVASGALRIEPYDRQRLQPASYEVTLADDFRAFPRRRRFRRTAVVDPLGKADTSRAVKASGGYVLRPGELLLGRSQEFIELPDDLACQLMGKSSLARIGLLVHVTAGWVDPGFYGTLTLEFANLAPHPIRLTAGMPIAQIGFIRLDREARRPYGHPELGSRYQGQISTTGSRYSDHREAA